MRKMIKAGIIGATGYAGNELVRILMGHKEVEIKWYGSRSYIDKKYAEVYQNMFEIVDDVCLDDNMDELASQVDVIFTATPQGFLAGVLTEDILNKVKIIDLSADFIIKDVSVYEKWYKIEHKSPQFIEEAVYGLCEINRDKVKGARLIANPGCYATAIQLAIAPLVSKLGGVPSAFGVSGYSGAGTTPSPRNDAERLKDNLMPYALTGHKHEREATRHLGKPVRFTPHVHPAFSGILITAHIPLAEKMDSATLMKIFEEKYSRERLIALRNEAPELKSGTGRKGVVIGGFTTGEDGKHAVVVAAEDNLLKGAAVQAIQNVNLALGLNEYMGLT